MRLVLGFVSTLAVGFSAAALIAVTASDILPIGSNGSGIARLDFGSLGLGLIIGILISGIARFGWADIPRRLVMYVLGWRGTIRLMGWAAVFGAVLLLY